LDDGGDHSTEFVCLVCGPCDNSCYLGHTKNPDDDDDDDDDDALCKVMESPGILEILKFSGFSEVPGK